jgi:Zn-dependent protease
VEILEKAVMVLVPMILSLSVHEYAHARVAWALGDDTARRQGRLTLNPLSHIDPFGTLLLPILAIVSSSGFFFGWARPVPINPVQFTRRLRMKTGVLLTAAAGPASNILFAFVIGFLLNLMISAGFSSRPVLELMIVTLQINVVLAIFNLLPVPPLDGSRVLVGLLPDRLSAYVEYLERNPMFVILAFAVLIMGAGRVLAGPIDFVLKGILHLTGNGWLLV